MTKNGNIVVIKYICYHELELCALGQIITEKESIENYPIDSTLMNICKIINISKELHKFNVNDIKRKVCLFIINGSAYVIPQLHH